MHPAALLILALAADPRQIAAERALQRAFSRGPLHGIGLRKVNIEGQRARIDVEGGFGAGDLEQDLRMEALVNALLEVPGLTVFEVTVQGRPLPRHARNWEQARAHFAAAPPPITAADPAHFPFGAALAGRRIAISAGHGFKPDGGGGWVTQRAECPGPSCYKFTGCGTCRGINEDFFTADFVSLHLVPLLEAMGAEIVQVREPDHATDLIVADDAGAAFSGPWAAGVSPGGWAGGYQVLAPGDSGTASFAGPPAGGPYRVAVRYVEGWNRGSAVPLALSTSGGTESFALDQRAMGQWWKGLGWFWPGPEGLAATIAGADDGYAIADAVRFGGGQHAVADKPWWQMDALEYVTATGAPSEILAANDVTVRPMYAEYVGAEAFVSIHANASGDPSATSVTGSSSYRYTCDSYPDHSSTTVCDDPPGSRQLQDLVHGALIAELVSAWDPAWRDRGKLVANFGEVRELDDMPGVLIETAFFDGVDRSTLANPPRYADNRSLHDPRFRAAAARGIARGLAAFFTGTSAGPPPAPARLRLRNQSDGSLIAAWQATPGALGYKVFAATGGRQLAPIGTTTASTMRIAGLAPRSTYYVRVASLSAAGQGPWSHAVGARVRGAILAGGQPAEALLVDGYDRQDAWVQEIDNTGDYAVEQGEALAGADADLFFDGALDEAVESGDVDLGDYALVVWSTGRDSTEHQSLTPEARAAILAHHAAGGAVLLSGAEIGYDLNGSSAGVSFLAALGASYRADDGGAHAADAATGGPLAGLPRLEFDDGTHGTYAVDWPDAYDPAAGGAEALRYPGGGAAAVSAERSLLLGAPLETFYPLADRALLVAAALEHLVPGRPRGDRDLDGMPDAWELAHALMPGDGGDAASDADTDGWTNLEEYRRGTDPQVADRAAPDAGPADADAGPEATDAGPGPDSGPGSGSDSSCGCSATDAPGLWPLLALLRLAHRQHRHRRRAQHFVRGRAQK